MYSEYDKIIEEYRLSIEGIFTLPIGIVRETYVEYENASERIDAQQAESRLSEELYEKLLESIGQDGQVVTANYSVAEKDGLLYVTLRAECLEQIGYIKEMTQEEKSAYITQEQEP